MTKPALVPIASGSNTWDTTVNSNNAKIGGGPFFVKEYADFASLPAAALNDRCIAATTTPPELWISDGGAWRAIGDRRAHGARTGLVVVESERTLPGQATWANARPAGARDLGVSIRVTQLVTSGDGATTFKVGDGSDDNRYADAVAFAANTTKTPADSTADPGGWHAAAGDIVITPIGGTFSGGKVRVVLVYQDLTAPTS